MTNTKGEKIRFNSAPTRPRQQALRFFVFSLSSQKHIECRMDTIRNNTEHDALKTDVVFLYIYYITYYFILLCFCSCNASFFFLSYKKKMGRNMRKPTKCIVCPVKTQISLRLRRTTGDRTFKSVPGIQGIPGN